MKNAKVENFSINSRDSLKFQLKSDGFWFLGTDLGYLAQLNRCRN
jgi:hypothetical protein